MKTLRVTAVLAAALCLACGGWKRFLYERGDRDAWQKPEEVVAALDLEPGDRVADLGSGSGYFTVHLARAVGPSGKVYAVDVDEEMNEHLRERVREEGLDNVEVILGEFDDPLLPDGEVDVLFTSNTYHHLEDRPSYFYEVRIDLVPGGRVAIVDFDGSTWFPRLMGHYSERDAIVREMQTAGYALEREPDLLERQSFMIFSVWTR